MDLARRSALQVTVLILLVPASALAVAQEVTDATISSPPRFTLGVDDVELFRVTDGTIMENGTIVVADAGNRRLLLFTPAGEHLRTLGRMGRGPGELLHVSSVYSFGDTVLAYDGHLRRVNTWLTSGDLLGTVALPSYQGQPTALATALSPDRVIVMTRQSVVERDHGLQTDVAFLLLFEISSREVTRLDRRAMSYTYVYHEVHRDGVGVTGYETPFLSSAHIVGTTAGYAFLPLDSRVVELNDTEAGLRSRVRLPIPDRSFDRTAIDSIMATADGPFAARIRSAFGAIATPALAPYVGAMERIGEELWCQMFPVADDVTQQWYVIVDGRLARRAELPLSAQLLGGGTDALLLLERDELGVETVAVHDIGR